MESPGSESTNFSARDTGNAVIAFTDPSGWTVDAARGQKDPPRGWFSSEYGKIEPAWEARICRRMTLPFDYAFAVVPSRGPTESDVSVRLESSTEAIVTIDGEDWPVPLQM